MANELAWLLWVGYSHTVTDGSLEYSVEPMLKLN